jgi:hypothetical protein
MEAQMIELQGILDASELDSAKKEEILLKAITAFAPVAVQTAGQSAGGDFLQILMQLLIQFLPILLKLLGGG